MSLQIVSVLTPTYNRKELLEKAILSVIKQRNEKRFIIEIIVVDDGSTDGTKELMKEYINKYPDIIKFYYKENGGVGSARNFGLSKIDKRSTYIIFLDDDDELYEGILEKYMDTRDNLKKKGLYDKVLFIDSFAIDQDGKLVGGKEFMNNQHEIERTPDDMLSIKINFESGGIGKSSTFLDNPEFRYPEDIVTESVLGFQIVKYMLDRGLIALRIDEIGRMYRRNTEIQITKTISKNRFKHNAIGNDRIIEVIGDELLSRKLDEQYAEYFFRSGVNWLLYGDYVLGRKGLSEAKKYHKSLRNILMYNIAKIYPKLVFMIYKIFIKYEEILKRDSFVKNHKYIILNTFNYDETVAPTLRFKIFQKFIKGERGNCTIIGPSKNKGIILNHLIIVYRLFLHLCKNYKNKNTVIYRDILLSPFLLLFKILFKIEIFNEFHGYYYVELKNEGKIMTSYIAYIFDKISVSIADKILSVSMGLNQSQLQKYHNKIVLVPNGVDKDELKKIISENHLDNVLESILQKDNNSMKIAFAGNAAQRFSIEDVIDDVGGKEGISFYIIGKGYNFNYLKGKIKNNYFHNIHFIGSLNNMQTILFLNQMNVLLSPYNFNFKFSHIKYFFSSKKNKEYVFLKKPIIMANIEGIDYIFKDKLGICLYNHTPGEIYKTVKKLESKEFYHKKIKELEQLDNQIDFNDILNRSGVF